MLADACIADACWDDSPWREVQHMPWHAKDQAMTAETGYVRNRYVAHKKKRTRSRRQEQRQARQV